MLPGSVHRSTFTSKALFADYKGTEPASATLTPNKPYLVVVRMPVKGGTVWMAVLTVEGLHWLRTVPAQL